jgi:hypothetical protein
VFHRNQSLRCSNAGPTSLHSLPAIMLASTGSTLSELVAIVSPAGGWANLPQRCRLPLHHARYAVLPLPIELYWRCHLRGAPFIWKSIHKSHVDLASALALLHQHDPLTVCSKRRFATKITLLLCRSPTRSTRLSLITSTGKESRVGLAQDAKSIVLTRRTSRSVRRIGSCSCSCVSSDVETALPGLEC